MAARSLVGQFLIHVNGHTPRSATEVSAIRIELEGLTVRYGKRIALDDVSVSADAGVVVLVGPNGSGKSTLLNAVATLSHPSSGSLLVQGHSLRTTAGRRAARRDLGFVPQHPRFGGSYTVVEAIGYAAWLHRVPRADHGAAVRTAISTVDLDEWRTTKLGELSGGTRQRVFIAQALVHEPAVLVLDEVTVGVDAEHRVALRRLIRSLAEDRLILLSTHLTEDVELLADRVIALDRGRIQFDGTTVELLARVERGAPDERRVESALRLLTQPEHGA